MESIPLQLIGIRFFLESSYHTKVQEPNLPLYLPVAGERIVQCIYFPRVLVLIEMKTASLRVFKFGSTSLNSNRYSMVAFNVRHTAKTVFEPIKLSFDKLSVVSRPTA